MKVGCGWIGVWLTLLLGLLSTLQLRAQELSPVWVDQFDAGLKAYEAKQYDKALQLFQPLAEAGRPNAQLYLAVIYDQGLGIPRDFTKAMYWYEQAAEQGDAKLQYDLGVRYLLGNDIPKDESKAVYWWQKSAAHQYAQAQYNLGLMYAQGKGVAADPKRSLTLYRLAAEQGLPAAQYALGLAYTTGQHLFIDYSEAYRLFKLAAEQGYPSAQYNLAALTESGEGVSADIEAALIWYRKAAAQGHELAQQRLARLEENKERALSPQSSSQSLNRASSGLSASSNMVVHHDDWIKKQPPSHYTIQLNVSRDKEQLINWLNEQGSLTPLAYYAQQGNKTVVYKAVYGSFADLSTARQALRELAEPLHALKPWVRRFSAIQAAAD